MRTFAWWFGMGALLTLGVLMVQGGVRDLLYGSSDIWNVGRCPLDGVDHFGWRSISRLRRGDFKPPEVDLWTQLIFTTMGDSGS